MKKLINWISKYKTYFFIVIGAFVAFSFLMNVLFTIQLKYENADLNEEIAGLENRLKSTKEKLLEKETDIYIKKEAENRFGMVQSDEKPVKIVEETSKSEEDDADKTKDDHLTQKKMSIFIQEWYQDLKNVTNQ